MKITITQHIKEVLLGSGILVMFFTGLYAWPLSLSAQKLTFDHLTTEDGLPSNIILAILQDHRGYLWYGTWGGGLVRYDGYEMRAYRLVEGDSTSLSDNVVQALHETDDGTLWVGTYQGGLNRFDAATETFKTYRHVPDDPTSLSGDRVRALHETADGMLWITTTGGLNRFDPRTETFKTYRHVEGDSTSLSGGEVMDLHETDDGTLWITNTEGLNRFDPRTETFKVYQYVEGTPTSLNDDEVYAIHETEDGTLWVSTYGGGLNRFDPLTETFKVYRHVEGDPTSLGDDRVLALHVTADGTLWVGTQVGLNRFEAETETFEVYRHVPSDLTSLSHDQVRALYETEDGTLWIGTWGGGLSSYHPVSETFEVYRHEPDNPTSLIENNVEGLLESADGTLWVGTGGGLNRFDSHDELKAGTSATATTKVYRHAPGDPTSLGAGTVLALHESADGTLWMGTGGGGLNRFDAATETFKTYRHVAGDSTSLSNNFVWTLHETADGMLWVGTWEGGLNRFDAATETFKTYRHVPGDPTSLSDDDVYAIHEIADGTLWVSTYGGGLNRFEAETETFKTYRHVPGDPTSLNDDDVYAIHETEDGTLWIGTVDGLNRLEQDLDDPTSVSFARVLTDIESPIGSVIEDEDGQLWLGLESGRLIRFNPVTGQARSFGKRFGLPAGYFNSKVLRSRTGRLYWSNMAGLISLRLDRLPPPSRPPMVYLSELWLFDEPLTPGPDSPLKQALWQTESLQLGHAQNDLTFGFVGIHYADPSENRYQYRLLGYDQDWRSETTQRRATYTNLPPGSYTFEVKAANSDGIWTEEPVRLGVEIMPPWWRTPWAYGLYGLLFLGMVFTADRVQRRRLIAKEREKARERELEQAKEIEKAYQNLETAHSKLEAAHENLKAAQDQLVQQEKLASLGQLTAGIAHEIKNPLNFVNNFSDLSIELVEEARDEVKASMNSPFEEPVPKPREGKSDEVVQGDDPASKSEVDLSTSNTPLNPLSRGEADSSPDKTLILDILDDIEMNLRKIHEHGTRADGIVKSMLQHSRGGSGKMEPTDVNALIKEYANLAFHGMRAGKDPINVDIELDLDKNVGDVEMIAEDFSRVILNLCNNAFDAMREKLLMVSGQSSMVYKPNLTVRTKSDGNTFIIEIEDNGPGIPEKIRDKIMQPFFTTKKGTAGTGLGLSITNDIIKAHGGNLDIQTDQDGSTFSITLDT